MLPQGAIWQRMRQQALAVVPTGTYISRAVPPTLATWLQTGAFTVTSTSSKRFTISASPSEIGGALFSEASFHLDHVAEHSVTVRHGLAASRWYSAAWLCVTFYYWAFFLALGMTRMLGKTGWFLSKADSKRLQTLASTTTPSPGGGPYILEYGSPQTVSQQAVVLRKAPNSRLHDLAWRIMFQEVRSWASLGKAAGTDQRELRLYMALVKSADLLGDVWPSDLRNLVNYAPGRGYAAVRHASQLEVFGAVTVDTPRSFDETLDRLEGNLVTLGRGPISAQNLTGPARVLIDLTFLLDDITRTLFLDILDRRKLDVRWSMARKRFLDEQFASYRVAQWPCTH